MKLSRPVQLSVLLLILLVETSISCRSSFRCDAGKWSKWTQCSETCGSGVHSRHRHLKSYSHDNGLRYSYYENECPHLTESGSCTERPCYVPDVPINCAWGSWKSWSSCSGAAVSTRSRIRTVSRPAMFGGRECIGSDKDIDINCQSTSIVPKHKCPSSQITCNYGMSCVDSSLACNGDNDCGDFSDEENCAQTRRRCYYRNNSNIPNAEIMGSGFNIVKNEQSGKILDNSKYNGRCSSVTSGDHSGQVFRLPHNLQSYNFQVRSRTSLQAHSYQSAATLFEEKKNSFRHKLNYDNALLSFPGIFGLSMKAAYGSDRQMRVVIEHSTGTNSKYFRIQNKIQVAQFRTRDNPILSAYFREREFMLPGNYDNVKYTKMITEFGTHYYSSGTLGGHYEYIYRYDRSDLASSGLSDEQQKECVGDAFTVKVFGNSAGIENSRCTSNSLSRRNQGSFTRAAQEVTSDVRGGTSETAAALSFVNQWKTPDRTSFDAWANTVKHNPAVVDYKLTPISAVFKDHNKRLHMERALKEYLERFNPALCPGTCHNGGLKVVVNYGKACKCLCAPWYTDMSCRRM